MEAPRYVRVVLGRTQLPMLASQIIWNFLTLGELAILRTGSRRQCLISGALFILGFLGPSDYVPDRPDA